MAMETSPGILARMLALKGFVDQASSFFKIIRGTQIFGKFPQTKNGPIF